MARSLPESLRSPALACRELVFVYGTLKRGHSNHHWIHGADRLGPASLPGLRLYDLGPFPMALALDPASTAMAPPVLGEVYAVTPAQLAALDRLEGTPRLYRRERWPLADGRRVWVYLGRPRQVRHVKVIADGCWRGVGKSWLAAKAPPVSP